MAKHLTDLDISNIVEILDACPKAVHHVRPLFIILRVGVQMTVVAEDRRRPRIDTF